MGLGEIDLVDIVRFAVRVDVRAEFAVQIVSRLKTRPRLVVGLVGLD